MCSGICCLHMQGTAAPRSELPGAGSRPEMNGKDVVSMLILTSQAPVSTEQFQTRLQKVVALAMQPV